MRLVSWTSCGDASAVCGKIVLADYGANHQVDLVRCFVPEEHPDNDRFCADLEKWYGHPIITMCSQEFGSCEEVWRKRRYMAGVAGAPCTLEMKKAVRWDYERQFHPDLQAFGYTVEERDRAEDFRRNNPDVRLITPLIDKGLTKADCHAIVARAGIELPAMYRLGFNNNNCIGCVKAQSPSYWNRVRHFFPEVFEARATLSRELGVRLIKGTSGDRERFFLDELEPDAGLSEVDPPMDCSLLCYAVESALA